MRLISLILNIIIIDNFWILLLILLNISNFLLTRNRLLKVLHLHGWFRLRLGINLRLHWLIFRLLLLLSWLIVLTTSLVLLDTVIDILLKSLTSIIGQTEKIKFKLLIWLYHCLITHWVLFAKLFLDNWDDSFLLGYGQKLSYIII